ncbi:2-hydroxychromene-2-carboxylate isomerase (plasmid) [Polymorphobacter sp. PAMC 29334]|uniref:2-hydroxychromene-2-carboxylate isomerase n=1 Tax=Polymorphobacter sp. PAMC 29334 TaxID=2862331 RepID=UPI001C675124|nr:2-hydroxychromene-2-carboxylate isomerase [Polymorphobacter sp. PAMC 29334]QYE32969.1 2-hydroxychromene-2-carboxylate isomerase [Polymorphobacter sp. PAMC 29334]
MTATIDFYFDFGSPNAYLCHRALPSIEARIGKVFVVKPVLLGGVFKATNNRSPAEAFAGIPKKQAYDQLEMERFIKRHDITAFRFNPFFPINTLTMMRGAHAAKRLGVFDAYLEAVVSAMWEKQLDMGQMEVFAGVLDAAGLPTADLYREAQSPDVKQALIDMTQELIDRGGFGIPTFFVGDEMFFGKDRLREVEEEFVAQRGD